MDGAELTAEPINQDDKRGPTARRRRRSTSLDLEVLGAAAGDVCILFIGSGPVKEIAQQVHSLGRGRRGRFKAVDCGWPAARLEQQLFNALRSGTSGTIFLADVDKLSLDLQARLLDALGGAFGSHGRTRRRVMASTSEPLLQRVVEGKFNERLFYRLNAIQVILPPDLGDR